MFLSVIQTNQRHLLLLDHFFLKRLLVFLEFNENYGRETEREHTKLILATEGDDCYAQWLHFMLLQI